MVVVVNLLIHTYHCYTHIHTVTHSHTHTFTHTHRAWWPSFRYISCKREGWNTQCTLTKEYFSNNTSYTLLKDRVNRYPEERVLGYRPKDSKDPKKCGPYEWLNGKVTLELVDSMAAGIIGKLKVKKGEYCGIITRNRYEWFIVQIAIWCLQKKT